MVSQSLWQRILVPFLSVSSSMQSDCITFYQPYLVHGHSKEGHDLASINIRLD